MTACVIIPTTGAPEVRQAIESVLGQSYETHCYVVCDGLENFSKIAPLIMELKLQDHPRFRFCCISENVGKNGFYGHRIYAAFTHLVNQDHVLYLDQDNYLENKHVQYCVETIKEKNADWCYSLRRIFDKDGNYLCDDNCESLGKWQTYHGTNLIDTNTYCLKREMAIKIASAWHGGWGQDRVFFATAAQYFPRFECTGEYTVNYRVDGGPGSVNKEFFDNGNKVMFEKYKGEFPWQKRKV